MREILIDGRPVGPGHPVYLVAEMSANHRGDLDQAIRLVHAAKAAGADAIKLQTYTPDTLTIDCQAEPFVIRGGTPWDGRTLHELYREAATPWEWHPRLQAEAKAAGLGFFSTPVDSSAVEFLEGLGMPAHKIASFELVDLPLLRRIARTGKPAILSTGMASLEEIGEAVDTFRAAGGRELVLLKCTSAYPAPPDELNLRTIPDLAARFQLPVGLSDHTLGLATPVAAVALGACLIEKHLTLSRSLPGPDSAFSLEPAEFASMARAVREAESALGGINYGLTEKEKGSRVFRRSLFVVRDVRQGDVFTPENVRVIRPGCGLHPRYLEQVLGATAACNIARGTPLDWNLVSR